MDIPAQLAVAHSRANTDIILAYVLADEARVAELMDALLKGDYRTVQRSAMVVGNLGRKKPAWLRPWHGRMIAAADPAPHPAVSRNVMRYFSELPLTDIDDADQGPLLDLAFRLTADQLEAVAIRVCAMMVVYHFCTPYPELKDELRGIIELTMAEGATAGFRSRGGKIIGLLNKRTGE